MNRLISVSFLGAAVLFAGQLAAGEWLPSGNAKRLGFDDSRLERIAPLMQSHVDEGRISGAVLAIARDGKIVYRATVGYADIESRRPMREDTVFRIYSMSKPITSAALMMLVEEGRVRLTDPVSKYIPSIGDMKVYVSGEGEDMELADQATPMTVHHLLTHTSGIPYGSPGPTPAHAAYMNLNVSATASLAAFAETLSSKPLVFQPGERWMYGLSTDVLGYVVEVASGQPFQDFVAERITGPLGMDQTSFVLSPDQVDRFATVYDDTDEGLAESDSLGASTYGNVNRTPSGGGGMVSTAADYVRFSQMLLNGGVLGKVRLLSPRSVELMSRNHLSEKQRFAPGLGFGLGFAVIENPAQRKTFLSEGTYSWAGAADTHFWIDPEKNLTAIALTQLFSSWSPLRDDMRTMTYQALTE